MDNYVYLYYSPYYIQLKYFLYLFTKNLFTFLSYKYLKILPKLNIEKYTNKKYEINIFS